MLLGFAAADGASIPPTQARQMIEASATARGLRRRSRRSPRADLSPLLARTAAPMGVIWGTRDRTIPARNVDLVREARPDARVAMIERAGHVPMVERPGTLIAALEGLLAALDKDSTTSDPDPSTFA